MKQWVVAIFILAQFSYVACSKEDKQTVYSDSEGNSFTITKGDEMKKMTFTTDKGTATVNMGEQEIPKDLGVPIYPGAAAANQGHFSMSGTDKDGKQQMTAITLTTNASIADVEAFYKKALESKSPQTMAMDMSTGKMSSFMLMGEDGYRITVSLFEDKEASGTKIQITKMKQ